MLDWWIYFLDWWNSLPSNEAALYATILAIAVSILGFWGFLFIKFFNKKKILRTENNFPPIIQNQIINIGLTLDQHEQRLKSREMEVRDELKQAHAEDRQVLERELIEIEQQLQDTQASYETHIASLKERIVQLEKLRGEFSDALLDQAIVALRQGENQKAAELFKQIKEEGEGHIQRVAKAEYQLGKIAEEAIQYTNALEHYERAVQLQPDNTLYLNDTGSLLHKLAHHQKAIDYFEQALTSDLKTYGEDHPHVATHRNNLGDVWRILGDYHKAIGYSEQALVSDLKTYSEDHPHVARDRNNLGRAWKSLGDYYKAIDYFEQALASNLKTYGEDHPKVARDRNNLGSAWKLLGEYQKAIDYYEKALTSDLKTYGENHPDVAISRNNLGLVWKSLGEYQKAIDYFKQALASGLKTYGEDHPKVALRRNNLGGAWKALGEYQKAIDCYEQALVSNLKTYGEDHPNTQRTKSNLEKTKKLVPISPTRVKYSRLS